MDTLPTRPPEPGMVVWFWWVAMAGIAGAIQHLQRRGHRCIVWRPLVIDIGASMLAGLFAAYIALASGLKGWWLFAVVGVSGHLGSRLLEVLDHQIMHWASRVIPKRGP